MSENGIKQKFSSLISNCMLSGQDLKLVFEDCILLRSTFNCLLDLLHESGDRSFKSAIVQARDEIET